MRYKSNLVAPDLAAKFRLLDPPKQILGHDAPSDPVYEPDCSYFTHDEAALLFHIARLIGGVWVDIGSRFGWTTAHLIAANRPVIAVDPCYANEQYEARFLENMRGIEPLWLKIASTISGVSNAPWISPQDGFVIDGNHDEPEPLKDARACLRVAKPDCAIVLHDFYGKPIRDAVAFLMAEGFSTRVYWTPNGIALCWRGCPDFVPPFHVRDPLIDWKQIRSQMRDFDFEACL